MLGGNVGGPGFDRILMDAQTRAHLVDILAFIAMFRARRAIDRGEGLLLLGDAALLDELRHQVDHRCAVQAAGQGGSDRHVGAQSEFHGAAQQCQVLLCIGLRLRLVEGCRRVVGLEAPPTNLLESAAHQV